MNIFDVVERAPTVSLRRQHDHSWRIGATNSAGHYRTVKSQGPCWPVGHLSLWW